MLHVVFSSYMPPPVCLYLINFGAIFWCLTYSARLIFCALLFEWWTVHQCCFLEKQFQFSFQLMYDFLTGYIKKSLDSRVCWEITILASFSWFPFVAPVMQRYASNWSLAPVRFLSTRWLIYIALWVLPPVLS